MKLFFNTNIRKSVLFELEIYDIFGKLVHSEKVDNNKYTMKSSAYNMEGVYILRLIGKNELQIKMISIK